MLKCQKCGDEYNDDALIFCPRCGLPLIEEKKSEIDSGKQNVIVLNDQIQEIEPVSEQQTKKLEQVEEQTSYYKTLPPILASKIILNDLYPEEPGKQSSKIILLISAVLLFIIWISPWPYKQLTSVISSSDTNSVNESKLEETYISTWGWKVIHFVSKEEKILLIYLAVTSLFFLIIALLPMPYVAKAFSGAFLSITPLVIFAIFPYYIPTLPPGFIKNFIIVGLIMLSTGLLYRKYYRTSFLSRIMVLTSIIIILIPFFYPTHEYVPIFKIASEIFTSNIEVLIQSSMYFVLFFILLLSFSSFLGPETTGGTGILFWFVISWLPINIIIFYCFRYSQNMAVNYIFNLKIGLIIFVYSMIAVYSLFQLFGLITYYAGRFKKRNTSKFEIKITL